MTFPGTVMKARVQGIVLWLKVAVRSHRRGIRRIAFRRYLLSPLLVSTLLAALVGRVRDRELQTVLGERPNLKTGLLARRFMAPCLNLPLALSFAVVAVIVFLSAVPGAHAQQSDEYRVKAAFLFHFAQLVDWPVPAPGTENTPLTVCTIGQDSFGGDLEATLRGKSIGTHVLQIRRLKQPQEVQGCQLLFVGGRDRRQVAPVLAAIKDEAVLTVGESDDFVHQGGMIGFCMENNKVRFDINVDAAARVKLKISSRLLLLAKNVIGNRT